MTVEAPTVFGVVDPVVAGAVHAFICREARLADEGRYLEWLDLWASSGDIRYWVAPRDDTDPLREVSYIYDDRDLLEQRVARWNSGFAWAQDPRSKTNRILGNVEIAFDESGITARANVHIFVARRGQTMFVVGQVTYRLIQDSGSYRLIEKKLVFLDGDAPVGNITFVL